MSSYELTINEMEEMITIENLEEFCGSSCYEEQVYHAAALGFTKVLAALLNQSKEKAVKALKKKITDDFDQICTPLIIASKNGCNDVVKIITSNMKEFDIDLEVEGTVRVDSFLIEGASSLWSAAAAGEIAVVKTLVKAGADVNHGTLINSTPVRAACFDGRLDIVKYLVRHGANVHIANKFNNTCLMIASYKGHIDIVRFLLQEGVNINERANCGATALHFAAECGNIEVVRELTINGAKSFPNKQGMTPVMAAAERTRLSVVEYLVKQDCMSKSEKIDALELLGASFANDKESYSLVLAYKFLQKAMEMRYSDPREIIQKPYFEPVLAYNNRRESRTLEELELIRLDEDALHMEALTIRERLLGLNNPDVAHSVIYRGAVFADHLKFHRCILLWLHVLRLSQTNENLVAKDLLRFSQVFSQMAFMNEAIEFDHLYLVLETAVEELERIKTVFNKLGPKESVEVREELDNILLRSLYIVMIMNYVKKSFTISEDYQMKRLIFRLIKLDVRTSMGQSLLHLCVDPETISDTFHTNRICKFPCSSTAKLLLHCGADANALDINHNSPLHTVMTNQQSFVNYSRLFDIISCLLKYDAHPDIVNIDHKTPNDLCSTGLAAVVIPKGQLSLKCLAARSVQENCISYKSIVPRDLEEFIVLHGYVEETCIDKI